MVGVSLRVGVNRTPIAPGGVTNTLRLLPADQRLLGLDAIAVDTLPQAYLMAKAKLTPPAPPEKVVLGIMEDVIAVDDGVDFAIVDRADTLVPTDYESEETREIVVVSKKSRKRGR
jgi:hypothetical protein